MVTRLPNASQVRDNKSAARAGMWPAILVQAASAIAPAVQASQTEGGEPGWRIVPAEAGSAPDPALAELTALGVGTSRVAVQETVVLSAAALGDSTDRALAAAAAVARPASDLAVAGEVLEAVAGGAGRRTNTRKLPT